MALEGTILPQSQRHKYIAFVEGSAATPHISSKGVAAPNCVQVAPLSDETTIRLPETDMTRLSGNTAGTTYGLVYDAATGRDFSPADQPVPDAGFEFTFLRGTTLSGHGPTEIAWKSYAPAGIASTPAPRFTICLYDQGDSMSIERPDGTTDTYNDLPGNTFPQGSVKVIFQDASYNPTKHDGSTDHLTWHWDNITIE